MGAICPLCTLMGLLQACQWRQRHALTARNGLFQHADGTIGILGGYPGTGHPGTRALRAEMAGAHVTSGTRTGRTPPPGSAPGSPERDRGPRDPGSLTLGPDATSRAAGWVVAWAAGGVWVVLPLFRWGRKRGGTIPAGRLARERFLLVRGRNGR